MQPWGRVIPLRLACAKPIQGRYMARLIEMETGVSAPIKFQNSDTLAFLVMKPGDGKAIYDKLAQRSLSGRQEVAKPITAKGGLSVDDANKLLNIVA
jgi:hypothetical protein